MKRLYICRKCDKPKKKDVKGSPLSGKKLIKKLDEENDLPFEIISCSCLGNCKKGPNGLAMPGKQKLHRLSLKSVQRL